MTIPEFRRAALALAFALAILVTGRAQAEPFLFTANTGEGSGGGSVTAFAVEPGGSLDPHPEVDLEGPEGVAVSPDGRHLYVAANGTTAEVAAFSIGADGRLSELPGSPFATEGLNAWGVAVTPSGDRLVVSNRGTGLNNGADPGSVAVFDIDPATGALSPVGGSPFAITGVEDPSRVAISPDGRFVLASGDASGMTFDPRVAVFELDPGTGFLTQVAGSPFATGGKQAVPILVSPDGGRVFVGNVHLSAAGESISVLDMNQETGALTPVAGSPFKTAGTAPIGLSIAPDGSRLFSGERVAMSLDRGVSVYDIGPDGALSTVAGSPFTSGNREVRGTVVSADGRNVYAIASANPGVVLGYAIGPAGALAPLPGSPYPTGDVFSNTAPIAISPVQTPQPSFTAPSAEPGEATAFDGTGTSVVGGRAIRFDWDFGDGSALAGGGPTPSHAFAQQGTYRVTLTVTNDCAANAVFTGRTVFTGQSAHCNGPRTASVTREVTVADRTSPVISKLRIGKRFLAGARPTAKASKARVGTRISFDLSEPAQTRIAVQRRSKSGRKARFKSAGALSRKGRQGRNVIRFSGRVGRAAPLSPGRYRIVVTATDGSGNASTKRRKSFRIVAP